MDIMDCGQGINRNFDEREAQAALAASNGSAALVAWLKAEMLDDESAMIYAKDAGEWERYRRLEAHRDGLLHVLHHVNAEAAKESDALSYARCDLMNALSALNQGRLKDSYMEAEAAQRRIKQAIGEAQQNARTEPRRKENV